MIDAYIGIDVGTQALKLAAVGDDGQVLASAAAAYETGVPQSGWREQNPQTWREALVSAWGGVAGRVRGVRWQGIGLTGQMHTLVVADEAGRPLRPAILWSDQRAAAYGDRLRGRYGLEALLAVTGNLPLANFSLLKLLWIRDHEAAVYRGIRHVAVAKDWVRHAMTGLWATDVTDASGTYGFDVARRRWAASWLDGLGVNPDWWPAAHESREIAGTARMGLSGFDGLPVVAGAGDQEASAVGTGLGPGDLGVSLGTSGVLFWILDQYQPAPHPSVHVFCHADPNRWHWMTVTQAAALSVRWLRDVWYPNQSYEAIDRDAALAPPGSEGLLYLPYLGGERAPILEPAARGGFYGLDVNHGRAHMARAVLEGVSFSLADCYLAMNRSGALRPGRVVMTGGGAQSAFWRQMMADVLGMPVTVTSDLGAAVGAAWIARNGIMGRADPYPAPSLAVVDPDPDRSARYREAFAHYQALRQQLQPLWRGSGR